jgi:hypothetical protein
MRNTNLVRVVAAITIVVLVIHGIRGWTVQRRWVSCVIEVVAAIIVAWLWWVIEQYRPRPVAT